MLQNDLLLIERKRKSKLKKRVVEKGRQHGDAVEEDEKVHLFNFIERRKTRAGGKDWD